MFLRQRLMNVRKYNDKPPDLLPDDMTVWKPHSHMASGVYVGGFAGYEPWVGSSLGTAKIRPG